MQTVSETPPAADAECSAAAAQLHPPAAAAAADAVTRAGKFLCLYKHVGNRVLVNVRGDLIVRPSYVEYALRRTPGGSVTEHYLTMYQRAMAAVVRRSVWRMRSIAHRYT